ncbi:MAG: glycoside hydrolase family 3 C-terminal domain-containing protein [Anaerofustis sp.]
MNPIVTDMVSQMTLEEKAALCSGADNWHTVPIKHLKLNSVMMCDGPHGLRKEIPKPEEHFGMSESEPATCFPPACALASSWNRALVQRVGEAIAEECRNEDVSVLLGPGVNIKRSPLCGRNFEYYSEDPYLSGQLGASFVKGVQSRGVGATVKHFAVNSQEYRRMVTDSVVDERALREIYLYAFEQVIKLAHPWCVMSSYNKVNGTYASENKMLLTDLLRDEWGFRGAVMTDWGAMNDVVASIQAGLNLEMPSSTGINPDRIILAVREGRLSEDVLDRACADIVMLVFQSNIGKSVQYLFSEHANHFFAQRAAEECIVLLKNRNAVLPIAPMRDTVAVIGEMAVRPRYQGTGSSKVNPSRLLNPLDEIRKYDPSIAYAQGYDLDSDEPDERLESEALALAATADKVVVFAGLPDRYESEGFDRESLSLPENHNHLIDQLLRVNPNLIVLLSNGAPVSMPWVDRVPAVLEGYLCGQAGAGAMADILFGAVNPSGKLAETFPLALEDTPCFNYFPGGPKTVEYRESLFVGYRYYQSAHKDVLFPFGYGLSYTTFEYSELSLSRDPSDSDVLNLTFRLKNVGHCPGKETAQLYVRDLQPLLIRPESELKGFEKVFLNPGESETVQMKLHKSDFGFFDTRLHRWNVYSADYQIMIGASSEDIRLTEIVSLKADDDYAPPYSYRELISYYDFKNRILTIPDLEFKRLYGAPLPRNDQPAVGTFDLESTLGDIRVTFLGNLLYRFAVSQQKKQAEGDKKNKEGSLGKEEPKSTDDLMIAASLIDMPLKSLVLYSGGILDYEMADGLLMMLNKQKGGFKALRKAYHARRKTNRKRKKNRI